MGFSIAKSAIENGRKTSLGVVIIGIWGEVSILGSSHRVDIDTLYFHNFILIGTELESSIKIMIGVQAGLAAICTVGKGSRNRLHRGWRINKSRFHLLSASTRINIIFHLCMQN